MPALSCEAVLAPLPRDASENVFACLVPQECFCFLLARAEAAAASDVSAAAGPSAAADSAAAQDGPAAEGGSAVQLLHAALCQGPVETALLPGSPGLAAMGAEAVAAVLTQARASSILTKLPCVFGALSKHRRKMCCRRRGAVASSMSARQLQAFLQLAADLLPTRVQLGGRAQAAGTGAGGDASLEQLLRAVGAGMADNLRHSLQQMGSPADAVCDLAAAQLASLAEAGGGAHRCTWL